MLGTFKDYQNYKHVNNPKAREVVESVITDLNLCDIWRDLNPDCQRYTWRRTAPFQQAKLDFFLVTDPIVSLAEDSDINCGYRTDHSMVLLKLKFNEKTQHKTFWKFNSSLLKDKQYLDEINELIDNIIVEYAVFPYARDSIINMPIRALNWGFRKGELSSKGRNYYMYSKGSKTSRFDKELETNITIKCSL